MHMADPQASGMTWLVLAILPHPTVLALGGTRQCLAFTFLNLLGLSVD